MNKNQLLVAVIGIVIAFAVCYIKFVVPIAKLRCEHPEIFASNPPNAVVGGHSGTIALFVVFVVTIVAIVMLRGKG